MKLTIGMPSYNNTNEVWWTCQVLRAYHDLDDVEILVVDNYGSKDLKSKLGWMKDKVRYLEFKDIQSPAHAKNKVFEEAKGEWVMCIDSHIFFLPDTIKRLKEWISDNKDSMNLYQGPLLYDNLKGGADHFKDVWSGHMWGQWASTGNTGDEPYDIPMLGCGLLLCRKDAWLGFSKHFRGFGAEEGYIHEKFRQYGRRTMCIPWLKWVHYFQTVGGKVIAPYTPKLEDKIYNYKIVHEELGLDPTCMKEHFNLTDEKYNNIKIPNIKPKNSPQAVFVEEVKQVIGRFSHWEKLPMVSCQCITYGRIELLEEAIECFLRQDYPGEKELVILNDNKEQILEFNHPEVRIINKFERYNTIGEKRDACVDKCKGQIILPWDDDDISLPWRISVTIEEMKNHNYFKPKAFWFSNKGKIQEKPNRKSEAHAMGGWSKEIYNKIGGYGSINSGQDTSFEKRMRKTDFRDERDISKDKVFYIYRWGTGHYHLSGYGYDSKKGFDTIKNRIEKGNETMKVVLKPHWKEDYVSLIKKLW